MHAEIDFHHIVVLQDNLLAARTRSRMRGSVIEAQTSRKRNSRFQAIARLESLMPDQGSDAVLDTLCNIVQSVSGLDDLSQSPLAHLTMSTSCLAILLEESPVKDCLALIVASFLGRGPERVLIVPSNFAFGIVSGWVQRGEQYARRR